MLSAIVVVAVVGAATAVIIYRHWKTHATYLYGYHGINESQNGWSPGRNLYVGADIQPTSPRSGHRRLELRHVTPQVTVNTAGAQILVFTCPVADPYMGMGIDSSPSPCASTRPFRPGTFDVGFPATEIIYKITPARAGIVRIEGADVSYCGSGRCGDQRAGAGMIIHVTTGGR